MKVFLKILAATVVMAGVCLLVYELFRRWDEGGRKRSDLDLRRYLGKDRKKIKDEDTIADYRYDDDDDLFDDDFFADLDGVSHNVEVEVEDDADNTSVIVLSGDDDDDDDVISDEGFDLSEDALEQLLDN